MPCVESDGSRVRFTAKGRQYIVDVAEMWQRSLSSGNRRKVKRDSRGLWSWNHMFSVLGPDVHGTSVAKWESYSTEVQRKLEKVFQTLSLQQLQQEEELAAEESAGSSSSAALMPQTLPALLTWLDFQGRLALRRAAPLSLGVALPAALARGLGGPHCRAAAGKAQAAGLPGSCSAGCHVPLLAAGVAAHVRDGGRRAAGDGHADLRPLLPRAEGSGLRAEVVLEGAALAGRAARRRALRAAEEQAPEED
mmetsp:Transcript_59631/g.141896  ORF Transcript_59631/g.141896 Transcript_59631/m.141896 type:complete len:250 (+) Transcript_59631:106-855(+)